VVRGEKQAGHPLISHRKYLVLLAVLFAALWVALAIEPRYREDWALENALVVAFAIGIAASHRKLLLSRVSYTLIFLFLCLHEVGAHYTYAEVPYDAWVEALTGSSLNEAMGWERNHFDRLAHFLYGLLMAYPLREFFLRVADVRGFWGYFLPLDFTLSTSAIFELFEWGAAEVFGGDLGAAYLGTQGDIWDAHKDMALASAGALIAMLITAGINAYLQHDFAREWQQSLRIKASLPLGEDEIARLHRAKKLRG
jgi:putative membrane protein